MLAHLPADVGENLVAVGQLDPEDRVRRASTTVPSISMAPSFLAMPPGSDGARESKEQSTSRCGRGRQTGRVRADQPRWHAASGREPACEATQHGSRQAARPTQTGQ